MDYQEEQRNEIEALESIYCNELQGKESHEYVGFKYTNTFRHFNHMSQIVYLLEQGADT